VTTVRGRPVKALRGRVATAMATGLASALTLPVTAHAHGISQRSDLPIPEWLFIWAAGVVLIVSFVALGVLWPRPRLEEPHWRPLVRLPGIGALEALFGLAGVLTLLLVIWSGLAGQQLASGNFASTFVYVIFWVGLVFASALLGDVYRAFNPWRAIGRAFGWTFAALARRPPPVPLPYPERLGRWPAVATVLAFAWLELALQTGDTPRTVALATLVYTALTFVGMALYGVETWIERGEGFSVYFNLFARLSPFQRRGDTLGLRRPLSGLTGLDAAPGTVALLATMIGTITFDGASEGALWQGLSFAALGALESAGLAPLAAVRVIYTVGLVAGVALIYALYRLAAAGVRSAAGASKGRPPARAFVHTLVPIALAYVAAHYLTLLAFQGQAIAYLVSDPLGTGADLLGTAGRSIDYSILGANATWYWQVGFVVAGHVAALTLAHDRALVLYDEGRVATRSQLPMLAVMVAFTTLALWLLSQANA
jgi:hypothetical protein